jgi:molecular chaperone IbpA
MALTANDVSIFNRLAFGSERAFDRRLAGLHSSSSANWPPYDIVRTGPAGFQIILAAAGYTIEELSITFEPYLLTVAGAKAGEDEGQYLYRGIAERSFLRRFELPNYVEVRNASLENGLLKIDLAREIPEAARPREIEIATVPAQHCASSDEAAVTVRADKTAA